jgi:hypothetical protein
MCATSITTPFWRTVVFPSGSHAEERDAFETFNHAPCRTYRLKQRHTLAVLLLGLEHIALSTGNMREVNEDPSGHRCGI